MLTDLKFALRQLRKSHEFISVVLLTLGIGIGAVSAIYSLVYRMGSYRTSLTIYGIFATDAILLSMLGIYGVIPYNISHCRGEIGLRLALGASRSNNLALILSQGARLPLIGISSILAIVSMLACYSPSRRASKADPMLALRTD